MAKFKRELVLTNEEIDALTKADLVLEKILKVIDAEDGILLDGDIKYPGILDEIYQDIGHCFY